MRVLLAIASKNDDEGVREVQGQRDARRVQGEGVPAEVAGLGEAACRVQGEGERVGGVGDAIGIE